MKILFQFSDYSIKYTYFAAKKIIELDNKYEVGLLGTSDVGKSYLKNKDKIFDQYLPLDNENFKPRGNIDYDILNNFEIDLEDHSIWKVIASDRSLGRSYSHGSIGYDFKYSQNREYILEFFSELIKSYSEIFDKFKPDIFLPALAMGDIGAKILEIICKKKNVRYLNPESVRLFSFVSFASDTQLNFLHIENKFKYYLDKKNSVFSDESKKILQKLHDENDDDYFDKKSNAKALNDYKYENFYLNLIYIFFLNLPLKIIYDTINLSFEIFRLNFKIRYFKKYINRIKFRYLLAIQKIKLCNPKYIENYDISEKYIYFPLMGQPEYGINVLGTMWMNQIALIESISKNLPFNWFLYVKEHPSLLNDRIRTSNFYKKIKSYPNVKLIDVKIDSKDVIKNSSGVFVISGTSGFEAILNNKPVFETRKNLWSIMNLSKRIVNQEDIYKNIINEQKRINSINGEAKKKILLSYIQAILDECFVVKHPNVFFYERIGSQKENIECGNQLGEFLHQFINK